MVLVMAGAFMTLSVEQTKGEPIATMSHEIEIAGSACETGNTGPAQVYSCGFFGGKTQKYCMAQNQSCCTESACN